MKGASETALDESRKASASVAPVKAPTPWWSLDLLDNRYPALHGFRVLAIVSVVQYHVTWVFAESQLPMDGAFVLESLRTFYGMDLFFLLSGFLIGSILLRSLDTTGKLDIWRFYLRRIFRTFPPYYLVLAYLAWITPLSEKQWAHLPAEIVYGTNFVSLSPNDVVMFWGWSLALEEQFYLVVPALFFVLHRIKHEKSRIAFLVVLAFGALARRLWMLYFKGPWTPLTLYTSLYFRTPTRYDALVWGVLLAIVYQRWGTQIRQWLSSPRARASLAVPSLGLWWVISTPDLFGPQYEDLVHVLSWGTLTCAMYYGFVLLLLQGEGLVAHLLGAEFFRKTATLGYGVYLVHIPLCYEVLVPLARRLVDKNIPMAVIWPVSLFTVLAISFVLAYVLHVLVEKPALRLRQALTG